MSQNSVPLLAVVLRNLRVRAGWTQTRLEREARLSKGAVSRLEKGDQTLDRFLLDRLARVLAVGEGEVERAIIAFGEFPAPAPVQESPADLPSRDWQTIEAVTSRFSRRARRKTHDWTVSRLNARRWRAAQEAAGEAWQRLRKIPSDDRRPLVETVKSYQTWAVVERICEESARMAANDVEEARKLAQLARWAAAATSGSEAWRSWVQGYAAAFEANAWQVEGDLRRSQQVFSESDDLMSVGAGVGPIPLDRTRPLVLRAALLISLSQLDGALAYLDQALAAARTPLARTRAFICRAEALKKKLLFREAIESLAEARRYAEISGDARLCWAICFNEASYLCEGGDVVEAESRLRILSAGLLEPGSALNKLRLRWLTAKVAAAAGHLAQAATFLQEVWEAFSERRLWFDAALAVLELASIELERGHTREVKGLAAASSRIFASLTLSDELFASIRLFWGAAQREEASAQTASHLLHDLRRAGRSNAEAP